MLKGFSAPGSNCPQGASPSSEHRACCKQLWCTEARRCLQLAAGLGSSVREGADVQGMKDVILWVSWSLTPQFQRAMRLREFGVPAKKPREPIVCSCEGKPWIVVETQGWASTKGGLREPRWLYYDPRCWRWRCRIGCFPCWASDIYLQLLTVKNWFQTSFLTHISNCKLFPLYSTAFREFLTFQQVVPLFAF